ncbi:MAG: hypothetical protein DBY16_01220 [Coprobacter sp.]|jgi:hypothetical protein|nr:hypothetical protein [Barnesiella sp. GGCC_0306]MBS7040429.1 hypothetical protein [Bacteroidales bacterium]PWM93454.1 MAG: hypothetical protein DBY16_01220 [Coprobacter sp.]
MKFGLHVILAGLLLSLTSCSSISSLSFDTICPAEVTFPQGVRSIVVVNNAAEIPVDNNIYSDLEGEDRKFSVKHDSLTYRIAEQVALRLSSTGYFNTVGMFYDDSISLPKDLYPVLSSEQLQAIREDWPGSAVLTIDKADVNGFLSDARVMSVDGDFFISTFDILGELTARLYLPGEDYPQTYRTQDTIYWQEAGLTPDMPHSLLPELPFCYIQAASHFAQGLAGKMTPYKETVERFLFTSSDPAMKDAGRYWKKGKYDEASYLWEYIYENQKNAGKKARAASNIALYYELNDNFKDALLWANRSLDEFMKRPDDNAYYVAMMRDYIHQLTQRRSNDAKLKLQMGY